MLRERLKKFPVSLLAYCITSNHTHMLVKVREGAERTLGRFMQSLEGDFGQYYNLRKKRRGAFWSDRYHAVMVDSGEYLWKCMKYIDMNMVRAGVVKHPAEWKWCGYRELVGLRKRNRLVDYAELSRTIGDGVRKEEFQRFYAQLIQEAVDQEEFQREAMWTESLAVGSQRFVEEVGKRIRNRMAVMIEPSDVGGQNWIVREEECAYG
jgi:putative transposase